MLFLETKRIFNSVFCECKSLRNRFLPELQEGKQTGMLVQVMGGL